MALIRLVNFDGNHTSFSLPATVHREPDTATTIRAALAIDAPAVLAIAHEVHAMHAHALPTLFQPPGSIVMTSDDIARMLSDERVRLFVAVIDDMVAGYAHAEVREVAASAYKRAQHALHVVAMAVSANFQRRGVGRALLDALRTEAMACGLRELSLEVYTFNAAARALYLDEGFVPVREYLVAPLSSGVRDS